ncbi:MAG: hypothetical protein A3E02_01220 [Candidatus Zambryskibacteria bacterium RIFCSPHIGHO2_12_FULL_38_34]|uniref:Pilus assembly protein PilO n=1 Tax=Candidatus Zambryskibacteria bacterium RIFCSPLOWO2_12_FULL_39_16 TaxID=1802775 RepID=A0A1G2UTV7_9BACT|nr:MAG: hypothetical protein A3D37_02280 [Candidatus Zambryskibacteria bacterium RIFCSPHIGHO2_02_FULL_38_22]OHA97548.1 MAG: hypothetical protein A3E02_01220 [Candidatus Zambryskibacteria bacterium RIFCSPHIGHO2_12_FULL_38_34]OHB08133.1 MAG: hypothetical protein A3I19_02420 [Candidatus Zambryskibacteria bacterium RIFCSPLOWO2_02_FULL_38_13]OHB12827.1 MAG: hypothetical protein A3G46_02315 [Candidatus Zambryskibacteria bacterium RIFCSPLOWO2_12_FULL_39_16]
MSNTSIIAYAVLTLSIGYAFVYPSFGDLNSLLDKKQEYANALNTISNIEDKKNELLTEFNNISEAKKTDINIVLPSSLDFVRLISQIDTVAASHGISIDKISSKNVDSPVGTSIENPEPQNPYNSSIIGFSFVTSYDNFKAFLSDLEKSLRILDVKSTRIETQDKNGLYLYDVEFETYWLK